MDNTLTQVERATLALYLKEVQMSQFNVQAWVADAMAARGLDPSEYQLNAQTGVFQLKVKA